MMIVNVITITKARLRTQDNRLSLETYLHFYTFSTTKQQPFHTQEIATTSQI